MIRPLSHPKSRFKIEKVERYIKQNFCYNWRDINDEHDFIAYHFEHLDITQKKKLVRNIHQLLASNSDCK